ncbi:uncharacterized protein N7459_008995 [Penicillium hispanicum]|uniref:uncharacterized protein n=1 Tax=Penicillium hispanicum TaxID=1080232 RepID=UPI002541E800|nr:uncharacterized protein N7459_008995 [Penicillium hispanicum]KAJ5569565.1 hypothetical protein N7459_008995 [Penicillium hispanicum]
MLYRSSDKADEKQWLAIGPTHFDRGLSNRNARQPKERIAFYQHRQPGPADSSDRLCQSTSPSKVVCDDFSSYSFLLRIEHHATWRQRKIESRMWARKVKCDELFPSCRRCVSTGRVCDGYGVWGGGGKTARSLQPLSSIPRTLTSFLATSAIEHEYLDWLRRRTVSKLPGTFISQFWETLLLQASATEPAILHAGLALGAIHKRGIVDNNHQSSGTHKLLAIDKFALNNYIQSIHFLRPHFSTKSKASSRTILIACIVFVSLELLRGHFTTAREHLEKGLQIREEAEDLSKENSSHLGIVPRRDSIDDWIIEAFSRLHVQMGLFSQLCHGPYGTLKGANTDPLPLEFSTVNETWRVLESLLQQTLHLSRTAFELTEAGAPLHTCTDLWRQQNTLLVRLQQWFVAYKRSNQVLRRRKTLDEEKAYSIVGVYHTMITIMAELSLNPSDEMTFDSQAHRFDHLIRQMTTLWTLSKPALDIMAAAGDEFNMSRSIVDMGCISPLYYVAVKCRNHRLRLQAVRLLESVTHREGVWDAKISACAARKVMELEEAGYYMHLEPADHFSLLSYPAPYDLLVPPLPKQNRICDVELVLHGSPTETILLFCRKRQDGEVFRSCLAQYDILSRSWHS